MNVTVFGGSKPLPNEPAYQEALRLGQLLGSAGFTVLTGGYVGVMEAVSCGGSQAGGHVIGVTCDEIETYRPGGRNPWVKEEIRFPTIRLRLMALIDRCDAAIALPGGAGTLAEISVMWNHLITGAMTPKPMILVGTGWKATFGEFFSTLGEYIPENDRDWLSFVPGIDQAFIRLQEFNGSGKVGNHT